MRKIFFISFFLLIFCSICYSQTYTLCNKWVDCGNGCQLLDPYYSEGVTFRWTGASKNNKAHGYGIAKKYVNGEYESTYEGEYNNGIRSGKGTFTHKDGSTKKGTFINGQLMGFGTMESEDGQSYEGNFINYRCHGNGKAKWGNGSTFDGYWVADEPYTGKYTNYDGRVIYIQEGKPVDRITNRRNGSYNPKIGQRLTEYLDKDWKHCSAKDASYYRIITYSAPHTPKGIVRDYYITGELQGEGTFVYVDYEDDGKNFSEGEMKTYYRSGKLESQMTYYNNKPNGPRTEYYENGKVKSESFFKYGVIDGVSTTYYKNGSISTVMMFEEGNLKNNKYLQLSEDNENAFLIYNEDFVRNSQNWEYNGPNGTLSIESSEYISFSVTPDRSVSGGLYANFSNDYNGIIDVAFKREANATNVLFGVLIGFEDWENYSGFLFSGNSYRFVHVKNGKDISKYDWEFSDAIQSEINKIRIANSDNQLSLEINDQTVKSFARPKYSGNFICLTAVNSSSTMAKVEAAGLTLCEVVSNEEQIKDYLPTNTPSSASEWTSSGSGFFIDRNGYIATNYHVIEGGKTIQATFIRDGKVENWPVKVVLSDKQNDLSILMIDDTSFTPMSAIPYNFSFNTKDTGTEVFTLGYPMASVMGEEVKFTDGKISSKTGIQGDITVYQISVPIQPGNSGGPLFDSKGNLIGITSSGLNRDYFKSENVNYAIKSSYLKALADAMANPIVFQTEANISEVPLTEKIKRFQPFMVYLRVR